MSTAFKLSSLSPSRVTARRRSVSLRGAASANSLQYTGRENDGTGLYYYRARYYNPTFQRFISEDPLEFGGGDINLYTYTFNSPTNYTDPSGEFPWAVIGACAAGGAFNVGVDWLSGRKVTLGSAARGCAAGVVGFGVGKVVGKLLPKAAGFLPGAAKQEIRISESRLAHVLERHSIGGAKTAGKSVFSPGEDIANLIRQAKDVALVQQPNGNFARSVDAGRIIGIDRNTGQPTSVYTVITDKADNLITAFPGLP